MAEKPKTLADVDAQLAENENFAGCDNDDDRQAVSLLKRLWEKLLEELAPIGDRHHVSLERDPCKPTESKFIGRHLLRHDGGSVTSYTFSVRLQIHSHNFESATTLDLVAHPSSASDGLRRLPDWKFTSSKTGIVDLGIGEPTEESIRHAARIAASVICNDAFSKARELGKAQRS